MLVLAAMQPALLLSLLASPQLPSCDSVPLASKARSIDSELRGWAVSPAAVPVLFGWSAYVRLLACYRLLGELGVLNATVGFNHSTTAAKSKAKRMCLQRLVHTIALAQTFHLGGQQYFMCC